MKDKVPMHATKACERVEVALGGCKWQFCFLDHAFSIMKTKINQQNAQINSGLIYY